LALRRKKGLPETPKEEERLNREVPGCKRRKKKKEKKKPLGPAPFCTKEREVGINPKGNRDPPFTESETSLSRRGLLQRILWFQGEGGGKKRGQRKAKEKTSGERFGVARTSRQPPKKGEGLTSSYEGGGRWSSFKGKVGGRAQSKGTKKGAVHTGMGGGVKKKRFEVFELGEPGGTLASGPSKNHKSSWNTPSESRPNDISSSNTKAQECPGQSRNSH